MASNNTEPKNPARRAVARPKKVAQRPTGTRTPTADQPPTDPWTGLLDDGDSFTYGASMEVKNGRGQMMWPKASATVHKRPGESEDQTASRAAQLVHEALAAIVNEHING